MRIKNTFKNIALWTTLTAASIFSGCSTPAPRQDLAQRIDYTNDALMECEKNRVKSELKEQFRKTTEKVDGFYTEKQRGLCPEARTIRKLDEERRKLERELLKVTDEQNKELEIWLSETSNISGNYSNEEYNKTKQSPQEKIKRKTRIGLYYGKLFQDSSKTKESLGPAEVTGIRVDFPYGYLLYESGRKNDIKKKESVGYSETDTSLSSLGGGLKFNLIESKLFEMDLNAGIRRTTERFNSRGKVNRTEFNINEKNSFNGLDLGVGFTINFNKWLYATLRGNYTNWSAANKGEDLNSRGTYTVTLNVGGRF